ncbi:hypothetical protein HYC85_027160 [Camellia sinensis]|uniref:Uncharacterized protein n=1 Tax=Camellia sinensis TaxID=4442 RepID=A0A7J7G7Y8_CAMSI|nr:hypothetical protein HYC85_027160 [Camellia sinensis]
MLVWMLADEVYPRQVFKAYAILGALLAKLSLNRKVTERYQQLMASLDVRISKKTIAVENKEATEQSEATTKAK